jgi:polyphosphate kinase 2 (PPK2 family)
MSDPISSGKSNAPETNRKLKRKEYERELARLHVEFVKLQQWVVHQALKVCIIFEGRDGAGKGGTIKAMTGRVSPRIFRVVALPHPRGVLTLYWDPVSLLTGCDHRPK